MQKVKPTERSSRYATVWLHSKFQIIAVEIFLFFIVFIIKVLSIFSHFTVLRSALQALYMLRQIRPSVRLSVGLSVRHTPVLGHNKGTQRDAVFTVEYNPMSRFLTPKVVDGDDPV